MMTKYQLMRHALKLWNSEYVPKSVNRDNARKWIQAVDRLGSKWVYAEDWTQRAKDNVERINNARNH